MRHIITNIVGIWVFAEVESSQKLCLNCMFNTSYGFKYIPSLMFGK